MKTNVSVIVKHQGRILLMQRSLTDNYFPGAWGIPGGNQEEVDKSLEDTAKREVMEELGIQVIPIKPMFSNKNEETDTEYHVYLARLDGDMQTIKLSDEANDSMWATRNNLEELEFTPFTKNRLVKVFDEKL